MNAKQKYNSIILNVEDGIRDTEFKADELMLDIAGSSGIGARDLNAIMVFLTERTLLSYIRYRKLMAAYKFILESEEFDISTAIDISGYELQSSFTKEFSKAFQMPPKEAFKAKDFSLYDEPMLWDRISGDVVSNINIAKEILPVKKETIFGINPEQYARAMEASELQELYSFDRIYSQVAYDVSTKWEIPLKNAFEYMESWRIYIEEDCTEVDPLSAYIWNSDETGTILKEQEFEYKLRQRVFSDSTIKFLYFSVGLSVTLSIITMSRMANIDEEITEIDPFLLFEYAHTKNFDFRVFMEDYQYFVSKINEYDYNPDNFAECFENYVDLLCGGICKEEAFVMGVVCCPVCDDVEKERDMYSVYLEFEKQDFEDYRMNSIEREAEEIERWNNTEPPIDMEYDPDNPDPYDEDNPWLLDDEDIKRRKHGTSNWDEDDEDFYDDEDDYE